MKIILASASPRRREILEKHGIEPVVMPTDADEFLREGIGMTDAVRILAERKARACYTNIRHDKDLLNKYHDHVIIGSDTIVYKDEIMGKPEDAEDARRMLRSYRGTFHYVVTGITLIDVDSGNEEVLSDVTRVWCKDYTDEDIENYISMAEPYDKAGACAIQGYFGRYIDHIEGDYENVVGLPYYRIEKILENC